MTTPSTQFYIGAELRWNNQTRSEHESSLRNLFGPNWFVKGERSSTMNFESMSEETRIKLAFKFQRDSQKR